MSKNNKKVPNYSNFIPLGPKSKSRNTLPSLSTAKRVKTEDFNPSTFISTIEQSIKQDNGTSEASTISFLNSIKSTLITSSKNGKILPSQCLALFSVCKKFPTLFTKTSVVECMCGILGYNGKESTSLGSGSLTFKQQTMPSHSVTAAKLKQLHIAICAMLLTSFKDVQKWPVQLVKSYLDDSAADRVWVDLPECNLLIRNIETAFLPPGIDPRQFFPLANVGEQLAEIQESLDVTGDGTDGVDASVVDALNKVLAALTTEELIRPRFEQSRTSVDAQLSLFIKEFVDKKFFPDLLVKNVVRTLSALAGVPEVRGSVVTKLDNWLLSKWQTVTLNMLTIMASSINQNIAHNQHDITFCVYLMLKFKYKTSKPPVQMALLECLKRISEMHPNNLRNMLHIYVNNELYGTPTLTSGATINQPNLSQLSASTTHTITNKAISVTFPAIYFRFPVESIKILGDLFHEQICVHFSDIKPVKLLIRDLCRWIKFAHTNPGAIYNSFTSTGTLPDCLELLDLAQSLLTDRHTSENLCSRMSNPLFKQAYVDNVISVLCELQMLSLIRPSVKDNFKEKKGDLESIRHHYTTLRQIRYLACKWLKNIFRLVESQISPDRMTFYIKQVMFLNVTRNSDQSYTIDDSYAINDVWANEPDKMTLIKGLTEIPLSEKLIQTMISLGFEKHLCYRPSEIVEMLSELIIRASACASTDIMPMNVTKGETVINNMFACCSYDINLDDNDPKLQVAKTLAYKSSFWKVCQALVIMACHCTESCGAFLWANYPTIKNLMKIVITNNFENSNMDDEAIEIERMHCETDAAKIIELECSLYGEMANDSAVCFDSNNSKLVNLLMLNLPQGATRQPPPDVLSSLKSINSFMKIGDRLSQCRNPDFLLEIVKSQDQSKVANRKWIIDLVKKTSEQNLECLPLLCLTEFIYHYLYDKISNKMPMASTQDTFKRLVQQIRITLSNMKTDSVDSVMRMVAAFSNSFFNRLSDPSASTRNIARECLYILLQPVGSPIAYMNKNCQFMSTLNTLINLKLFQENAVICSIVDSLKETLKFETDIEVLRCYLDLFATMSSGCYKEWLVGVVDTLAILLLNRPIITDKLKSSDYNNCNRGNNKDTPTTLISDLLAEIFQNYIVYINQAPAIAIDHTNDVIMVTWKDKKFPMSIEVIQCQLGFLCWGIVKSTACKKLSDIWFVKSSKSSFELPQFSNLSSDTPCGNIVPQWLVNAAINSGLVPAVCAVLNYHLKQNRSIAHSITPAFLFMPVEFITAYLKLMNSAVKDEKSIVEAWIATGIKDNVGVLTTVEKMYSKVKRVPLTFVEFLKSEFKDSSIPVTHSVNFSPRIIVKPLIKKENKVENKEKEISEMEIDNNVADVWHGLIESYKSEQSRGLSISCISDAVNRLLSSGNKEIKAVIGGLIKLLKDSKTHSETLRVLNKSDFNLLPLLRLTFRSVDQDSYNFCVESFHYLFNSYPHIEKLSVWKMAYTLCLLQGAQFADSIDSKMEDDDSMNGSYGTMVKGLVTDIMHGSHEIVGKGTKIDQLTILGLGNASIGDESYEIIHRLLFASHSLVQYSGYFMSDLLHQSSIDSLRAIVHSLLKKKSLSNLNASRALDFIDACINHRKLQFPAVLIVSNRHLWPQQNVQLEITELELINLLALIINEADHLVQHNGLRSELVNQVLSKRCQLVEIASSHPSMINERYDIINRYMESKLHHNPTIEKLIFALYSRMPSMIFYDKNNLIADNDVFFNNVNCFSTDVLHRIGKRLLSALVSTNNDTQDLAIQACKAMVYRHPKLSVQLLPNIVALSDGALDSMECWLTFKKKRGNILYSNLLHLLEIMAPFSLASDQQIRSDVISTLSNFLRILIRYRDQPTVFENFVIRLVNFIERLITFGNGDETFVVEYCSEISALSRIYPQFKNLIGYGQKNLIGCGQANVISSTEQTETTPTIITQLESLENFRQEMKKCPSGQHFKLLTVSETTMHISGLCFDDLRQGLCSPMDEVRKTAKQYLARYLNNSPERAEQFLSNCLLTYIMTSSYYWSRPFVDLALSSLRQTSMLAPNVTAVCLAGCARMFIGGNNGRGNYKDYVSVLEEVLDNVSLESFMESELSSVNTSVVASKDGNATMGQKRHYQVQSSTSDHEAHKTKRPRFK